MFTRYKLIAILMLALTLATGCTAPEPTAAPASPTDTPLPPTVTSAPPTHSPLPPTVTTSLTNTPVSEASPTAALMPTDTAAPIVTPMLLEPFSLEKSSQIFGATETFQIGLGDLDGDGDLDAVFANMASNDSQVWLNDGAGEFADSGQRLTRQGHGVGVGDLDGDGDLDLFITCAHYGSSGASGKKPSSVYLNDGTATFQESGQDIGDAELSGNGVNLIDVDGDGDLDAHVVYYEIGGEPDKVYLNDGAGEFSDSGIVIPEEVIAWGDLDADGDVDIFSKAFGQGYKTLLNDGTGHFAAGWQMEDSRAMYGDIALGDFDSDGDLDALVANGFHEEGNYPIMLLWNDGTGHFSDSGQQLNETKTMTLEGFGVGDLDGDGDLDVYVSNMDLPNQVWLNDGNGHFLDSGLRLEGSSSASLTTNPSLGDLDGDGDLDVFVGSFRGRAEIWFNTTPRDRSLAPQGEERCLGQVPPGTEVEVFAPGVVSIEEGKEYKITFSPDLQEIFFTRRTPNDRNDRIWYARLENGVLTTPELAPFAYDSFEMDPSFTPDGNRVYFNSWRPVPGEDALSGRPNVWFVDRIDEGWSEPQFLGSPINDYRPVYFSFADDGTLYFTRSSPREIWYAEWENGGYGEAQRMPDEINDLRAVAHPAVAPDESYIIVDSVYAKGGQLTGGLYISFKKPDGSWTEAVSMAEVLNATETDIYASARITPDGKYLFFEKYVKETDQADIYWVSTEVVEALGSEP